MPFTSEAQTKKLLQKIFLHALYLLFVMLVLYPLLVMAMGSLKTAAELSHNPGGIPLNPTLNNYVRLVEFRDGLVLRTFFNSVFVAVSYASLAILLASLAGFAFAKYRFFGSRILLLMILSTMMVPPELTIPPLYLLFAKIGWLDTYRVQIFPHAAHAFPLFMYVQYMKNIPNSLIDAARIDGAGALRIYKDVVFPTAAPATGALAVLLFLLKWDDYIWPLVMVTEEAVMPIIVLLPRLTDREYIFTIPWELFLAGSTLVVLPLLLVFLRFQDKFMSSVTMGAVKE